MRPLSRVPAARWLLLLAAHVVSLPMCWEDIVSSEAESEVALIQREMKRGVRVGPKGADMRWTLKGVQAPGAGADGHTAAPGMVADPGGHAATMGDAAASTDGALASGTVVHQLLPTSLEPYAASLGSRIWKVAMLLALVTAVAVQLARAGPQLVAATRAARVGIFYIVVSAVMIQCNRWLMQPGRFPFPFTLTFAHMVSSCLLSNVLRLVWPTLFPALEGLEVTPLFCLKFLPIGVPFALSVVCGNWAYEYLSVSFLQVMKQTNIVTIYVFSAIAGLEAIRRCSVILLLGILAGAIMVVKGEMHFVLVGFLLQVASSLCEATKVVVQSVLMSGQAKLDPLTMVLFMAPACLLANLAPWAYMEGPKLMEITARLHELWPILLVSMMLAFVLNVVVAQCIKELSAVGFLLCGIVKDSCIILTSAWLLDESLAGLQRLGVAVALAGVALYSLYKQNMPCFEEDDLVRGFGKVFRRLCGASDNLGNDIKTPPLETRCEAAGKH